MLRFLKGFFAKPKHPDTLPPTAPYKVEAPSTDWPFPKATEIAPEPVAATAPAKKPRAPARPKAAPVTKKTSSGSQKKPRAKKPLAG